MSTTSNTPTTVNDEVLADQTYQRLLPEIEALPADDVMQVNVDIPSAVTTVLGSLPELRDIRPEIQRQLPEFDLASFDKIEDYTLSLTYANAQYLIAISPPEDLQATGSEGTVLRATLHADVMALVQRGHIDGDQIKQLKGGNGYKNIATDLLILASVLQDNWSEIEGKCATNEAEIDRAIKLAQRILRVVGLREQAPTSVAAASDRRVRAFTLFWRAYDQARRAVGYLRWDDDDADQVAPSLYAGRGNGRRRATETESSTACAEAAQVPTVASDASKPSAQPSAASTSSAKPAGTPSSDPFMQ
ncbi:MAG: hypothetical protein JW940_08740 [Polyangiaceae bacterium]|nr:hypothetical protein [Polyangiaceae bacterium]